MNSIKTGRPRAILFDWDNTLMDTFPVIFSGHNLVREAMGLPAWSDAEAKANTRLAMREAFANWYGERAKEAEAIYIAHIRENHLKAMRLLDGADALLERLHAAGVPMGVVSNKRGEFLRVEIAALEWAPYFAVVMGADDVQGPGKPDPSGVLQAMDKMGIPRGEQNAVWYVGDTENDIKTAHAAGTIPVFIENHSMSDPEDIAALRPAYAFKNPRECLAYLTSLL